MLGAKRSFYGSLVLSGTLAMLAGLGWLWHENADFTRKATEARPTQATCKAGETLVAIKSASSRRTSITFYCRDSAGGRRRLDFEDYGPSMKDHLGRIGGALGGVLLGTLLAIVGGRKLAGTRAH